MKWRFSLLEEHMKRNICEWWIHPVSPYDCSHAWKTSADYGGSSWRKWTTVRPARWKTFLFHGGKVSWIGKSDATRCDCTGRMDAASAGETSLARYATFRQKHPADQTKRRFERLQSIFISRSDQKTDSGCTGDSLFYGWDLGWPTASYNDAWIICIWGVCLPVSRSKPAGWKFSVRCDIWRNNRCTICYGRFL